jgi:hypothetical protein
MPGYINREGMSLRDYFAAAALFGMNARDGFDPGQATPEQRASLAYIEADAMLAERSKETK